MLAPPLVEFLTGKNSINLVKLQSDCFSTSVLDPGV